MMSDFRIQELFEIEYWTQVYISEGGSFACKCPLQSADIFTFPLLSGVEKYMGPCNRKDTGEMPLVDRPRPEQASSPWVVY